MHNSALGTKTTMQWAIADSESEAEEDEKNDSA